jgi:hypothetical protein
LNIRSDRPIPGLLCIAPRLDVHVEIRVGAVPPLLREALPPLDQAHYVSASQDVEGVPNLVVWKVGDGCFFRLHYADGTEFLVARSGSQVWATWPDPLTLDDTACYLLGPVMGLVLRLQDRVCLHGSAVAVDGRAIVLVGPPGAGKSTTAAAYAHRGFRVLSDDVSVLDDRDGNLLVHPGNPRLRLWSHSVQTLFGAPDALPRLTPNWDKRYLDLGDNASSFQKTPLPLGAVYVLGERSESTWAPFVEPVSLQDGLMELVGNTYVNYLLDRTMRAREFELLSKLIRSVPVRRVVPHKDPACLPALCQTILEDFQGILRGAELLAVPPQVRALANGKKAPCTTNMG